MTHAARRPALTPNLSRIAPNLRRRAARSRVFRRLYPDGYKIELIERMS